MSDIQLDVRCDVELLVRISPIRETRFDGEQHVYAEATIEDVAEFVKRLCPADNLQVLRDALKEAEGNPLL